jgi:putative transcriptional regulator
MMIEKIENTLERNGFQYFECSGCFDIIAKRNDMMIIKILNNVDSLLESHANNLKIVARSLNATPCVIGVSTRRENLKNGIVYERFGIPTFTPQTLDEIIENESPLAYSARGGLFMEIDPEKLKDKRIKSGLTQAKLAEIVGVTKKHIYEHEKLKKGANYKIVERIEDAIGDVTITKTLDISYNNIKNEPRDIFQKAASRDLKNIGFDTNFIHNSPFNIIAEKPKDDFVIFSDAEKSGKRVEKNLPDIKNFSKISRKSVLVITQDDKEFDVPTIKESDLRVMTSSDLKKFVKKW